MMVQEWHGVVLKSGGKDGKPLSAQTVTRAHRVVHRALERCLENETLARNVASVISPPAVEKERSRSSPPPRWPLPAEAAGPRALPDHLHGPGDGHAARRAPGGEVD